MDHQEEWNEEMKSLGLDKLHRPGPTPPDDYFIHLPDQVLEKWKSGRQVSDHHMLPLRRMLAMAAVVTGIAFGITLLSRTPMQESAPAEVTSTEAYQYILEHLEEFGPIIQQETEWTLRQDGAAREADEIEQFLMEEMQEDQFELIF